MSLPISNVIAYFSPSPWLFGSSFQPFHSTRESWVLCIQLLCLGINNNPQISLCIHPHYQFGQPSTFVRIPFWLMLGPLWRTTVLGLRIHHESPQLSAVIINKCHKIMCSICTSYRAFFLLIGGLGRKVTLFCLPTKQSYIFPGACFLSWAGVPFQLAYAFHFSS